MRLSATTIPLIAHCVHSLEVGGMENGLINLINHLPPQRYRHVIICLCEASGSRGSSDGSDGSDIGDISDSRAAFRRRLKRADVEIICLHKREGKDWPHYWRLYQTLRRLQPALLHTRNLATIEAAPLAALAGVRLRVHGEHGRDSRDLYGMQPRYRRIRRLLQPWISHTIAVSRELESWLVDVVGAGRQRVSHIRNGVDTNQYQPSLKPAVLAGPGGFMTPDSFVFGSVGRMVQGKEHLTLVQAFIALIEQHSMPRARLRLMIIGDGPCRADCLALLQQAGLTDCAWLPGQRDDIAPLLRAMDVFVLPSLAEGMSNTVLEAMASALPVVATSVGANPELLAQGRCGTLVAPGQSPALARAMAQYFQLPALAALHGQRARRRAVEQYSLASMTQNYLALYDSLSLGHLV